MPRDSSPDETCGLSSRSHFRDAVAPVTLIWKQEMETGTVKWFNDAKGYGFITPDAGGEDLFAHFSEVRVDGFKSLQENQKVTYETKVGPKGKQAANITPA
jgi:cold shock protein